MVPGSIPGAGATIQRTPQPSALETFSTDKNSIFTTFLQQSKKVEKYLFTNSKYLQKISYTYYLVFRLKDKILKRTLKTSNP